MENIIKKRKLKLKQPLGPDQAETLQNDLLQINGVLDVVPKDPSTLLISYDLMLLSLESIENKLKERSNSLSDDFFSRYFRSWINFAEDNERENLKIIPHSCCQDPKHY